MADRTVWNIRFTTKLNIETKQTIWETSHGGTLQKKTKVFIKKKQTFLYS